MTTMLARWPGRCRRCGKAIAQGSPIAWSKDTGAVHSSPEACENASALAPPLRGPQPEDPEERARLIALVEAHPWRAAMSARYKDLPHEYSLKRQWHDPAAFVWAVQHIFAHGRETWFIGRVWVYWDHGPHEYWTCGVPPDAATCGLINRAVRRPTACLLPLETTMATTIVTVDTQAILDKLSRGEVTLAAARAAFQAWLRGEAR